MYPFGFRLVISYELSDNVLKVSWKVENPSSKTMYFSIGAHPALMCEPDADGTIGGNYLKFEKGGIYTARDFKGGMVYPGTHTLEAELARPYQMENKTILWYHY